MSPTLPEQINTVKQDLDDHKEQCRMDQAQRTQEIDAIVIVSKSNTTGIKKLTESTQGLVDGMIAAKVLKKFAIYLAGFLAACTAIVASINSIFPDWFK